MKKNLLFLILTVMLLLSGCGKTETDLIVGAEDLNLESIKSIVNYEDLPETARYVGIDETDIPENYVPYIVVRQQNDRDGNAIGWSILDHSDDLKSNEVWSENQLEAVNTIVVAVSNIKKAAYQTSGGTRSTGYTESIDLYYYNVGAGKYFRKDHIAGKSLPDSASGSAPRYTLSGNTIAKVVDDTLGIERTPGWLIFLGCVSIFLLVAAGIPLFLIKMVDLLGSLRKIG